MLGVSAIEFTILTSEAHGVFQSTRPVFSRRNAPVTESHVILTRLPSTASIIRRPQTNLDTRLPLEP
jgi:hypothetical protein